MIVDFTGDETYILEEIRELKKEIEELRKKYEELKISGADEETLEEISLEIADREEWLVNLRADLAITRSYRVLDS